jgi:hypothetical protein
MASVSSLSLKENPNSPHFTNEDAVSRFEFEEGAVYFDSVGERLQELVGRSSELGLTHMRINYTNGTINGLAFDEYYMEGVGKNEIKSISISEGTVDINLNK